MSEVILYPEMNARIADILRVGDTPHDLYAAAYIDHLRAELDAAKTIAGTMAEYILSGVPLECETCTNHMRNMRWDATNKGCDGHCRHDNGVPDTVDKLLEYFKAECLCAENGGAE